MTAAMELALGTVQFGLRYGVAGRATAVPEAEVRSILASAHALGVRVLDTAAAYGDIEARLAGLAGGHAFRIVSKLAPLPPGMTGADVGRWAAQAVARARERLGERLGALLFHRAEDLLDAQGERLWNACLQQVAGDGIALGVSCYAPATLAQVRERFPVALAQLPGNALDQRLRAAPGAVAGVEIHLRSIFLQGLLLLPEAAAAARVPAAAAMLARWHAWCRERALEPLSAALGVAKGLPGVHQFVVGVDSLEHLEAIASAWRSAEPIKAPELAVDDDAVVDPRRWPGERA